MNRAGKAKYWIFVLVFLLLAAAIAAAGFVFLRHEKRQNADIEQLQNVAGALSVPREEVVPEIRRLQQGFLTELDGVFSAGQLNAYQKLASGRDISLLIVGDSIGALPWTSDVAAWIEENYQVSCTIKNISLGSNTAYTGAADLYGANQGTKIGSLTETGTITFTGNYSYVGIRSNNGAVYVTSVEIVWE